MFFIFMVFFFKVAVNEARNNYFESNAIFEKNNKNFKVFWNVPSFQCDSFKLNFSVLTEKYQIKQNQNDRFRGDIIDILYDPGSFPAILINGTTQFLRNGGVPQAGNATYHYMLFEKIVNEQVVKNFSGLAIIDFESWRPIFRQNFGSLQPYKDLSIEIVRKAHPLWPSMWVEKEATKSFEFFGQKFMEETLYLAKKLRPNATWGYYGYPMCYNMSPNNMKTNCPYEVTKENDRLDWLFGLSDNFHPSIYIDELRLTPGEKVQMIEGRINECHRITGYLNKKKNRPMIYPYFWYNYYDTKKFVSKEDLFNTFLTLSTSNIDGMVLWGSSSDVNTKSKCDNLFQYIDNVLGPLLISNFY